MKRSHMFHRKLDLFLTGRRMYEDASASGGQAAGGAGDAGQGAAGDSKAAAADTVSKADYEKVVSDLEELRGEVFSPQYLEFLEGRGQPGQREPAPKQDSQDSIYGLTPSQIESMSKADLMRHITKVTKDEANKEVARMREELTSGEKESVRKEIAAFSRSHPDFDKYRPAMHGLSMDPKNGDLTLAELYEKAKEMYPSGPSPEDKKKMASLKGEKPGGSSGSFEKGKKYTPEEAASEAWKETKEKLNVDGFPEA